MTYQVKISNKLQAIYMRDTKDLNDIIPRHYLNVRILPEYTRTIKYKKDGTQILMLIMDDLDKEIPNQMQEEAQTEYDILTDEEILTDNDI